MSGIDWNRAEEIFTQALACRPGDRTAFLDSACAGDPELRAEVESLLTSHAEAREAGFSVQMGGPLLRAVSSEILVGQRLGRFVVEQYLGEGGMGTVYRARDTASGGPVALKLIASGGFSSEERRRLEREASAAARIRHPNIVRVEGLYRDRDLDFLVMEYVEGTTLAAVLAGGPLTLERALHLGWQCAVALSAAHGVGVIHRDLKPSNIMVTGDGMLRLLDFGLCRFDCESSPGNATLTVAGGLVGTASYMSPEQAESRPVDGRSDIFSLGAVLYEMLGGTRAFDAPNRMATIARVLRDSPSALPRAVPSAVDRLVTRCLAKQPERRYRSAGELVGELEELRRRSAAGELRPRISARFRKAAIAAGIVLPLAALLAASLPTLQRAFAPARELAFTQITHDVGVNTEPAISRDGSLLAYSSDRGGEGTMDIWVRPLPSGTPVRLTHHQADDREPAFSPDGRTLAFRSESDGGIYTIPTAGGAERRLAEGRRPRFSPDGKWIAYWTGLENSSDLMAPGASRIYVVPSAGGLPRQLVPVFAAAAYPVWSPDSTSLLFIGQVNPKAPTASYDWWVAPISGQAPTFAAAGSSYRYGWPSEWTASGVLFYSPWFPGLWQIRIRPGSRELYGPPLAITPGTARDERPVASSAGAIVFASLTSRSRISLLSSGSPARAIDLGPGARVQTRLSADGKSLLSGATDGTATVLAVLDLNLGTERTILSSTTMNWASWNAAADMAFFQSSGRVFRVPVRGGTPTAVCSMTEHIWDLSGDGRYLLSLSKDQPKRIDLLDLSTCHGTELIARPDANLYNARFSSDAEWIVFSAKILPDRMRLYAARRTPGAPIRPEAWIALTGGQSNDGPAEWASAGDRVYFLSNRDGHSCIWVQRLDPGKRPVGEPTSVRHFHPAARYSGVEFAVSPGGMALTIQERIGNIWIASPR